jgi:hypothetical protein
VASTSCTKERQRKDKRLTRHALAFVLQRLHFLASSAWGKYASDSQFAASRLTLPATPGYSSCFSRSLLPSCLPSFLPPMPASIETITRPRSILYYFFVHLEYTTDLLSSLNFPYFWKPPHPANGRAKKAAPRSNNTKGN